MGRETRAVPRIKTLKAAPAQETSEGRDWTRTLLWPISAVLHYLHALLTSLLLAVVALGPMPHHIGFVMDGNRRYAKSHGQRVARGHEQGSESLKRTLRICLRLKIPVVSVYAFAIDNFRRSPEEVDTLMRLAQDSLQEICREGGFLEQHGVRLRCIGRLELLKPEMQEALRVMEKSTAKNTRGVLNVCGPYASRDEITTALKETLEQVQNGKLNEDKIQPSDIFNNLESVSSANSISTSPSPFSTHSPGQLDILVRTSDTKRLSDFMMWQAATGCQIHFVKTYWPDFGLTDLLPILLGYQQRVWLQRLS